MSATDLQQHYHDTFERVRDGLPGAELPWLRRIRSRALTAFEQNTFPDTRSEDWKYTDLRGLGRHLFAPPVTTSSGVDPTPWQFDGTPMHRLVFLDGHLVEDLRPFPILLTGATLTGLASALGRCPERLEPLLGRALAQEIPCFDAMNSAFLQDGAYLRLERSAALALPVHLLFLSSGRTDAMQTLRNVVELEPGSSATLIESWVTLGEGTALSNAVTEISLGDGAVLDHYKLVHEGTATTHIGATYARQNRSSRLTSHSVTLGGRLVRNTVRVDLEGEGAECALNGLTLAQGRRHVDNHTRIEHHCPRTISSEWYKSVLSDRARSVFTGRIRVHPGAQKTFARQANHNLLLSAEAEADARPQFEINADDVQCSHGCTVGALDADALFYLRSRGLDDTEARNMLVRAFAADVLDGIRPPPLREQLERDLMSYLGDGRAPATEAIAR